MEYNRTQIVVRSPSGRDILFDSIQEAEYYKVLLEKQSKGEIRELEPHPSFVIQPPFFYFGKKINGIEYTPDFMYYDIQKGRYVAIEVKGFPTPEFEIRLKLWKYQHQDIEIMVMVYSKGTGWLPQHEYKAARKVIERERIEQRYARQQQEQKEKEERARQKLIDRRNELNAKEKLTKKERERLAQIEEILNERKDNNTVSSQDD